MTAVHSVAGTLPPGQPLVHRPPYCAPHHSATTASLVGGGTGLPRPGAVSLAHHGVLFLDEAAECSPRVLDALRQPLESGHVVVARAGGMMRMPARFLLALAANPCPCGRHGTTAGGCECRPSSIRRYRARLSGPLMDRVDLRIAVEPVARRELLALGRAAESTATVAERVRAARQRAAARLADTPWQTNSEVPGHELRTRWPVQPGALAQVERDLECGLLTARGLDRVLRVAWTAADLAGRDRPTKEDVNWALELRTGVRRGAVAARTAAVAVAGAAEGAAAAAGAGEPATAGTHGPARTVPWAGARDEREQQTTAGEERPLTPGATAAVPTAPMRGERLHAKPDPRPRVALVRPVQSRGER